MSIAPLAPGSRLRPVAGAVARFEVTEVLGRGAFGLTYLARDHASGGETVVVKELAVESVGRRGADGVSVDVDEASRAPWVRLVARHLAEFERLRALQRQVPRTVRAIDAWEEHGTAYFAMERAGGRPIAGDGSLAWDDAWPVLDRLLKTLEAMHDASFFHFDLKPDHVLVDERGEPTVIDVGAGRAAEELVKTVSTAMYTLSYAPVECYTASLMKRAGAWSDLYSFGLIAIGAVCGHPTEHGHPASAIDRREAGARDPYADVAGRLRSAGVPRAAAAALARCIALNPDDRPQSVADLRAAMDASAAPRAGLALGALAAVVLAAFVGFRVAGGDDAVGADTTPVSVAESEYVAGQPVPTPEMPAGESETPSEPSSDNAAIAQRLAAGVPQEPTGAPQEPTGAPRAAVVADEPAAPAAEDPGEVVAAAPQPRDPVDVPVRDDASEMAPTERVDSGPEPEAPQLGTIAISPVAGDPQVVIAGERVGALSSLPSRRVERPPGAYEVVLEFSDGRTARHTVSVQADQVVRATPR